MERLPSAGVSIVEDRVSFGVQLGVGDGLGRSADVEVLAPLAGDPGVRRAGDETADDGGDPEGPELVERAGLTEALLIGMATRWATKRPKPMASGANPFGASALVAPRMM